MTDQLKPRKPWLGALISFFIPGLGSIVNGSVGMGILILVIWIVGLATTFVLVGFFIILVAWIWGLADGVMSAERWNRRHGVSS